MIPENNFILSECECGTLISFPEIDLQSTNPPFSLSGGNNLIIEFTQTFASLQMEFMEVYGKLRKIKTKSL